MKRNWKKIAVAVVPTVAFLLYLNLRRNKQVR